jgi:transcriptional regulator with XRE-family HTH domain
MITKNVKKKMPDEVIKLGTRISEIIKEKKYKTREVAHDADMDVENLRKYIKGRQEMRLTTLIKIAKSLDVTMEELFTFLKSKKRK